MTFAHDITHCIRQELLLLALPLVLIACYRYNKRSTMIDKLSLRLGEGGSCIIVKHDANLFVNTSLVNRGISN